MTSHENKELAVLLECLRKWKSVLVICDNLLELYTNFRGLKWYITFSLRSEIGYVKSQILFKNFGEYPYGA